MRPTYADIDLGAIRRNVATLRELISPSHLAAVVKADAYGHGDVPVAEAALSAGADSIVVALVEEGARLREAGVVAPILVLSEPPTDSAHELIEWQLTPTVYSIRFIEALARVGKSLPVHLKIDTGMHRVGAAPRMVHDLLGAIATGGLELGAVWSHFAVADEDPVFTTRQIEAFERAIDGLEVPMVHMANTAGAMLFPDSRRDMCRIGLGIYGYHPCPETKSLVTLEPAMRLVSHVTHVQRLEAGARPSYGRIRELSRESTVVSVPVGYADGVARGLSDHGSVLIDGRRYPLAGRVTMDQVMVDVGDDEVSVGDEVVLMGDQNEVAITADEWAEELGTISYEVLCRIGSRIPRRYRDE